MRALDSGGIGMETREHRGFERLEQMRREAAATTAAAQILADADAAAVLVHEAADRALAKIDAAYRPATNSTDIAPRAQRTADEADASEIAAKQVREAAGQAIGAITVAAAHARALVEVESASEELRRTIAAELREDRANLAEITGNVGVMRSQVEQVTASIVALQTHSLRQTGGVALALSVMIAIAWKVIGG